MRDRELLLALATDLASVMNKPAYIIVRENGEGYATTFPIHQQNSEIRLLATIFPEMKFVPSKEFEFDR